MSLRAILTVVVLASAGAGLRAQQQAPPTVSVRGMVVDAGSDAPLRRARVTVGTDKDAIPVFTDDQGRFVVSDTPNALNTIRVSKAGYVPVRLTGKYAVGVAEIGVALTRSAAVTGRVVDQYGRPESATFVTAVLVLPPEDRSPASSRQFYAETDSLGEYRLAPLPSGRFELRAMREREGRTPANLPREQLLFGPQTYVDVGDEKLAVTLKPGDELHDVNFRTPGPAADCGGRESQRPAPGVVRATIRGRVTGASGEPLPCVQVTVKSPDVSRPPAYTDEQGSYAIYGLPAGTLSVEAYGSGYVRLSHGQTRPTDRTSPVTLRAGEVRDRVDFSLPRLGILTGTVVDEHGEPVEGVTMAAFRLIRYGARVSALPGVNRPVSDDRGRYRITDVQPGRYLISATANGDVSGGDGLSKGYAPVYYPNTPDIAAATRVSIDGGQELNGIDINFNPTPTYTVSGRVFESQGPVPAAVKLAYSARSGVTSVTSRSVDAAADGTFVLPNVPPGDYVLQAMERPENGRGPFGIAYVRVADATPPPVAIMMTERSMIEGRLIVQAATDLESLGISVSARPVDPDTEPIDQRLGLLRDLQAQGIENPNRRAPAGMPSTIRDEHFRITGVTGRNRVSLSASACRTCYIKSVSVGGVDATNTPFDFGVTGRPYDDVEIVVSDKGATIDGRVIAEGDTPAENALVVVFPSGRDRWYPDSPYLRRPRSAADGSFTVLALPPADYFVAVVSPAVAAAVEGEWSEADVLEPLVASAQRVTVREGDRLTITVRARLQ